MKRVTAIILCIIIFLCPCVSVSAQSQAEQLKIQGINGKLTDDNFLTYAQCKTLNIKADANIAAIYVIYYDAVTEFSVNVGGSETAVQAQFLHTLVKLENKSCNEITLEFAADTKICDIYAFSDGELPTWVQDWNQPVSKADIMLVSSHADDEQLFFAGLLPLYASRGCAVQVVYYTDHSDNIRRRHELLNGLWTVGIKNYPVINKFPDKYSETVEGALKTIAPYTENDALGFQVEMIRRFKPQVVVSHDLNGEYGHGMHKLNAKMLTQAVQLTDKADSFPDSYKKYGGYTVKKLYVHLYNENKIVMDYDTPSDYFGGKTPFEMTKQGFLCHTSQQYTWFRTWLNGKNGEIKKASQIKKYSPCEFGLYFTTVGEDTAKNDMMENIKTYAQQEEELKAEQERKAAEELAAQQQQNAQQQTDAKAEMTPAQKKRAVYSAVGAGLAVLTVAAAIVYCGLKKKK